MRTIVCLLSLQLFYSVSLAAECNYLPSNESLANFLQSLVNDNGDEGGQAITVQDDPPAIYTCYLQGRKFGTLKQASVIMTYTVPPDTVVRTRQFEMDCIGDVMWVARSESLSTPLVDPSTLQLRRDCGACQHRNVSENDNHCYR